MGFTLEGSIITREPPHVTPVSSNQVAGLSTQPIREEFSFFLMDKLVTNKQEKVGRWEGLSIDSVSILIIEHTF